MFCICCGDVLHLFVTFCAGIMSEAPKRNSTRERKPNRFLTIDVTHDSRRNQIRPTTLPRASPNPEYALPHAGPKATARTDAARTHPPPLRRQRQQKYQTHTQSCDRRRPERTEMKSRSRPSLPRATDSAIRPPKPARNAAMGTKRRAGAGTTPAGPPRKKHPEATRRPAIASSIHQSAPPPRHKT
jgi:hypothetical protein